MELTRREIIKGASATLALTTISSSAKENKTRLKTTTYSSNCKLDAGGVISLDRLELQAKENLSKAAYAFIAGGAGAEWTLRENKRALTDFRIKTHRLMGIDGHGVNLKSNLLGFELPFPILAAPVGAHTFANPDGEIASAKGVGAAGTIFQCSGASAKPLESIAAASTGIKWFQLYVNNDIGVTKELLERAKNSGYSAIIVTADALGPGTSEEFVRLGEPFPTGFSFGNNDPKYGGRGDFRNQKTNLTLKDIEFVRNVTGLPVIVKGIMNPDDAERVITAGVSAIQVSNHGGRQLDGLPASISVLPLIVKQVKKRVPIILDGGIRRGIDVLRAISLGADAVAIGRPMLYGLNLGGAEGVQQVFEHLSEELRIAMLLAGVDSIKKLNAQFLL